MIHSWAAVSNFVVCAAEQNPLRGKIVPAYVDEEPVEPVSNTRRANSLLIIGETIRQYAGHFVQNGPVRQRQLSSQPFSPLLRASLYQT